MAGLLHFRRDIHAGGVLLLGAGGRYFQSADAARIDAALLGRFPPNICIASYGDPRTEEGRKLLAERSPINKVDNIKQPMLIFHGANDVRCKVAESDTIVAAMQAKNIPVSYVVYPDEGHGFHKPQNRLSYIAMTEAFFAPASWRSL